MKKNNIKIMLIIISVFYHFCSADVRLPSILSDNMVVQQNALIKFWGWAEPLEQIVVAPSWLPLKEYKTIADSNGRWKVAVETPKAGGVYKIKIAGRNVIEINNVLSGEVWLCSGQSNMEMPLKGWRNEPVTGSEVDIKAANKHEIRFFCVENSTSSIPKEDCSGSWQVCSPDSVAEFSALAYYFGEKINAETNFPVGLIGSYLGGTPAEAWTRMEFLKNDSELDGVLKISNELYSNWKAKGSKGGRPHRAKASQMPSVLYNAMIAPLTNMTIKGVIWYQGETNGGRGIQYRKLLPVMIENWRCDFNNYDMPFYIVQLAAFQAHSPGKPVKIYRGDPRESDWAELREAQLMTSFLKNTGIAVAIDIGDANTIHPSKKRDVGNRLAFWALAKDYGRKIAFSGPLYNGYRIEKDKIRLVFRYAESGLVCRGDKLVGFAIAGSDGKFVWADAAVDGCSIVVSSPDIKEPEAVRYGWDRYPICNLYNGDGLPASPFRTDNWACVSTGRE